MQLFNDYAIIDQGDETHFANKRRENESTSGAISGKPFVRENFLGDEMLFVRIPHDIAIPFSNLNFMIDQDFKLKFVFTSNNNSEIFCVWTCQ